MTFRYQTQNNGFPLGWLILAIIAFLALVSSATAQAVDRLETVGFTVSDMDKAIDFYTKVMPFEMISDREVAGIELENLSGVFGARARIVRLTLGDEVLELTEYIASQGRPIPVDSRSNDRWFQHVAIIVADMDRAYQVLRKNKVRHASTGPQTLPSYITAAAGIKAFYFKDFDGHVLEILSFPPDKGAEKWRQKAKTGKLFLGIDHTAIVVGDSDASLGFYRDKLGLSVAGTSDNYGPEQEHLNNVFGAKLHITGLRTKDDGIAVEFLEYIAPTDGRPYPADSKCNDLWHWQTSFSAPRLDAIVASFKPRYVSSGSVLVDPSIFSFRKAALIRDPDGHAVRVTERSN